MINTELKNNIIDLYEEISEIVSTVKVVEGYLSQNYILNTSQNRYFLKQYRDSFQEEDIIDVHNVIKFFVGKGVPAILPLKTKRGTSYFIFNSRIYSLFPFVEAKIGDRGNIQEKGIVSLAEALAKIHLLSFKKLPLSIKSRQGAIDRDGFLRIYPEIVRIIQSKEEKEPFDNLSLEVLEVKKSIVDKNSEKVKKLQIKRDHLLHGDYHEKNVFFDDNGEVKFIFDWEKTEIGDRFHELVRSMNFVCLDGSYEKENIDKARLYIQTYNSLYPIEKKDFIEGLEDYYLKQAHSLWIERTHYLENSKRVDCFLERELAALRYFSRNYLEFADRIFV